MPKDYHSVASVKQANPDGTAFDMMVDFGDGPVPFTASADDPEIHGRELFILASAGDLGKVTAFQPRVVALEELKATSLQVRLALNAMSLRDDVERVVATMTRDSIDVWAWTPHFSSNNRVLQSLASSVKGLDLERLFRLAVTL